MNEKNQHGLGLVANVGGAAAVAPARPLRLLVQHGLPFGLADEARVQCVSNPLEPFDLAYFPHPYDATSFREFVTGSRSPAAPLIAADDSYGARADLVLEHTGPGDLAHACVQLAPLAESVANLPEVQRGAERGGLLAIALAASRQRPLEATWRPSEKEVLSYDMLLGVDDARGLLERLADLGLFKRRYHDRLHCCASCGGSRVFAREVCSRCASSDLAEHELLHHYACGLQAPEPVFRREDGYECPKCRKPFRHYGVDYDKPGQVISCSACDATISEPDVFFVCADCGEQTDSEQAEVRRWYHYQLTTQGVSAAEAGVLPMLQRAVEPGAQTTNLEAFKVMVQNYVHVAERVERPLSMVRFDLKVAQGVSLERGLAQLHTLVLETARKGDAISVADGCVLACLPETDVSQVQPLLDRVEQLVGQQLADGLSVHPHVIPRDRVLAMLKVLG